MTNGELIELLKSFPPQFPVFFCADNDDRFAVKPKDAAMNLVDPAEGEIISSDDQTEEISRFVDSVVIYSQKVHEF